jgi:hypothetical protein
MTVEQSRPRIVTAAFWCWVVAAIALVALGMLLAFSGMPLPAVYRGAGGLFAVTGLALGYLAGRANAGHAALRRAAVGLALALSIVLALFCVLTGFAPMLLPLILTTVGAILMLRPPAQEWFDGREVQ